MAHRPEDVAVQDAAHNPAEGIVFRLIDVEPFAGLVAAVARFCVHMTPEAYAALPQDAIAALSDAQGILWRLEHANVEKG